MGEVIQFKKKMSERDRRKARISKEKTCNNELLEHIKKIKKSTERIKEFLKEMRS